MVGLLFSDTFLFLIPDRSERKRDKEEGADKKEKGEGEQIKGEGKYNRKKESEKSEENKKAASHSLHDRLFRNGCAEGDGIGPLDNFQGEDFSTA